MYLKSSFALNKNKIIFLFLLVNEKDSYNFNFYNETTRTFLAAFIS